MFQLVVLVSLLSVAIGAAVPFLDGRIVGGEATDIATHPYIVLVLHSNSNSQYCGGALISTSWVVTAAHCVSPGISYSIRAGSTNSTSGGQVIAVSRFVRHAQYDSCAIDYDIAVLELSSPVTIPNAVPIALAGEGGAPLPGSSAVITGWGAQVEEGPSSPVLQVVTIPVISQPDCRAAYGQSAITDRMFCVGLLGVGGKDACQGDSGGPVVIGGLFTGLVSWAIGCARPNCPGVKVSIPLLRSWIREITGI